MPSLKSARSSEAKRAHNKPVRTALKTYIRKSENLIKKSEMDSAASSVKVAIAALDKAAQKGVIHPNQAARRKSRLMKKFSVAKKTAVAAPAEAKAAPEAKAKAKKAPSKAK